MRIETSRLNLDEVTWSDLDDMHRIHSYPEVDEFNTLGLPANLDETRKVMRPFIEARSQTPQKMYAWKVVVRETGECAGLCGMILSCDKFMLGEIFYKLVPDRWGKGYATEIARALIKAGFETFKLHKVEAGVATRNWRSIRVLEKSGMTREGLRRKILPIRGQWIDSYHYAIVEDDPMAQPDRINAFGFTIPDIRDVVKDPVIHGYIADTLKRVLGHLGIPPSCSGEVVDQCLANAKKYQEITEYECRTHQLLEDAGVTTEIPKKLTGRANQIFTQIRPYLLSGSLLDLGSGDGKVGELCAKTGYEVCLTDVYKNPNIDNTGLPFVICRQGQPLPFQDNRFDNTLALTVYHHSDNPLSTIRESCRVTKPHGRVLVIESVYGVTGQQLDQEGRANAGRYVSLNEEQQRMVNIFFDHFYNRVIHYSKGPDQKVNVPFNFNTPDGWKKLFGSSGLVQEDVVHLGSDQPAVPEYHTLHILTKR